MGKRRSQPCSCVFRFHPGHIYDDALCVQEREAMRRKLLVLFVAFVSVFGVVACGGVEVEEEAEEAKQEVQEAQEEEKEAEKEREEAQEELKEAEKAAEEEQK